MGTPRIVALDMDGTLVDPDGNIPDEFWPLLEEAKEGGMVIAPASGRQLATLQEMFDGRGLETFIAENGAVVWHKGEIVSTKPLDSDDVLAILRAVDSSDLPIHPVVCTPEYAYVSEDMPDWVVEETDNYYVSKKKAASLIDAASESADPTIKVALFVETSAEDDGAPLVKEAAPQVNYAVSGEHWLDIMSEETNKGAALTALANELDADMSETAAIGDYLNDLKMLEVAGTAVAMENGHEDLKAIADVVAESNADHGALKILRGWLDELNA